MSCNYNPFVHGCQCALMVVQCLGRDLYLVYYTRSFLHLRPSYPGSHSLLHLMTDATISGKVACIAREISSTNSSLVIMLVAQPLPRPQPWPRPPWESELPWLDGATIGVVIAPRSLLLSLPPPLPWSHPRLALGINGVFDTSLGALT